MNCSIFLYYFVTLFYNKLHAAAELLRAYAEQIPQKGASSETHVGEPRDFAGGHASERHHPRVDVSAQLLLTEMRDSLP